MERIVVGVDGSAGSLTALRWAMGTASDTGATVEAITAWELPFVLVDGCQPELATWLKDAQRDAHARLEAAVAGARHGHGADADVVLNVVEGAPAPVLIEWSKGADLLVVGSRGRGGFASLLLGSVSAQCVHHAEVPVVVVPDGARRPLSDAAVATSP